MVMTSVENFLETLQKKFYLQNITIRRNFNLIWRDLCKAVFQIWKEAALRWLRLVLFQTPAPGGRFGGPPKYFPKHVNSDHYC